MNDEENPITVLNDSEKLLLKPLCIYVDCSETYLSGLNTGIQRVVINIIMNVPNLQNYFNISVIPVIAVGDNYISLVSLKKLDWYLKKRRVILESIKKTYVNFNKILRKKTKKNDEKSNSQSMYASWILTRSMSIINRMLFFPVFLFSLYECIKGKALNPKSGEIVFIPDVFWRHLPVLDSANKASLNGAIIIPLIHDIFPLLKPDYMTTLLVDQFSKALPRLLEVSSGILTTSKTMQCEIGKYLSVFGSEKTKTLPISFSYLGCNIKSRSNIFQSSCLDDVFFQGKTSTPYYLLVGTIEPRKGHEVALRAFESLWKEGEKIALVIVGRIGWKCQSVLEAMRSSPYRNKFLFHYDDISDKNLDCLYRMAKGLVFPSFNEGFGLPLVEGMYYGIPVIASDLPVFHEIAKEFPYYFRTGDSVDLARVIKEHFYEILPHPKERSSPRWSTWDESTTNFLAKLIDFYRGQITGNYGSWHKN